MKKHIIMLLLVCPLLCHAGGYWIDLTQIGMTPGGQYATVWVTDWGDGTYCTLSRAGSGPMIQYNPGEGWVWWFPNWGQPNIYADAFFFRAEYYDVSWAQGASYYQATVPGDWAGWTHSQFTESESILPYWNGGEPLPIVNTNGYFGSTNPIVQADTNGSWQVVISQGVAGLGTTVISLNFAMTNGMGSSSPGMVKLLEDIRDRIGADDVVYAPPVDDGYVIYDTNGIPTGVTNYPPEGETSVGSLAMASFKTLKGTSQDIKTMLGLNQNMRELANTSKNHLQKIGEDSDGIYEKAKRQVLLNRALLAANGIATSSENGGEEVYDVSESHLTHVDSSLEKVDDRGVNSFLKGIESAVVAIATNGNGDVNTNAIEAVVTFPEIQDVNIVGGSAFDLDDVETVSPGTVDYAVLDMATPDFSEPESKASEALGASGVLSNAVDEGISKIESDMKIPEDASSSFFGLPGVTWEGGFGKKQFLSVDWVPSMDNLPGGIQGQLGTDSVWASFLRGVIAFCTYGASIYFAARMIRGAFADGA